MRISAWVVLAFVLTSLTWSSACSCGDDDDDDSGDDDDSDDDDADDDTDDDVDDDADDDADEPLNCIVPVDYDGDGDIELLMQVDIPLFGVTRLYLVEPGTFERGDPILQWGSEVENLSFRVADFDGNDVWDILVSRTMPLASSYEAYYEFYMNGDFAAPAHSVGPFVDSFAYAVLMDADDNGRPEALVAKVGSSKAPTAFEWTFIDADNDFSEMCTITAPLSENVDFLPEPRVGEVWLSVGNVTETPGARELLAYVTYTDSGAQYGRFRAYDVSDGSVAAESDAFYLGDDATYSSGYAADVDGDGFTEAVLAHTVYSLVPNPTATFHILGGADLAPEWESATFDNRRAYAEVEWDFDGDGVLDVLFQHTDTTVSQRDYTAMRGVGGYTELFAYDRPADSPAYLIGPSLRGHLTSSYDFRGLGSEALLHETVDDGSTLTHGFRSINMDDGSMTGVLWEESLGEQAWTSVEVMDLGRDDVWDLVLLANKQTWNGAGWDDHNEWTLLTAPDFTTAFYMGLDNAYSYSSLWNSFDLTGDLAPDVVFRRYDLATSHADLVLYECDSSGCAPGVVIDYEANEDFGFLGPML